MDPLKCQFNMPSDKNLSSGTNFLEITCQNIYSVIFLFNFLTYCCETLGPIALPFNRKGEKAFLRTMQERTSLLSGLSWS